MIGRPALHGLRGSLHVHDDEGGPAFSQQRPHRVVPATARYIIHNFRARIQSRSGNVRLRSVDRNQCFAGKLFNYGNDAAFFFRDIDWSGIGAGRFAADIDDVGAVGDHFSGLGKRLRCLKKSAAIGK